MPYRGFGRPTGLRASYLVFAAGTFGTHWRDGAKPGAPHGSGTKMSGAKFHSDVIARHR
jgi:hypothetical protein